jgi:hypothetical protein
MQMLPLSGTKSCFLLHIHTIFLLYTYMYLYFFEVCIISKVTHHALTTSFYTNQFHIACLNVLWQAKHTTIAAQDDIYKGSQ